MPVLVIVDAQKEYVTPGRPFCLETIGPSLENLGRLLNHARSKGWKIIHVRHEQNAECFTYGSPYGEFIDGLEPGPGEESVAKSNFSCFSSRDFQALMEKFRHEDIYVCGYGTTMCCLSTMIDAHHRGYDFTFVKDATCAKRTARFGEQDMKEHIIDIMAAFGRQITTDEMLQL